MQRALVSIHDVMPSTLDRVEQLLEIANGRGVSKLTLLATPGVGWAASDVDRLRRWRDRGCRRPAR